MNVRLSLPLLAVVASALSCSAAPAAAKADADAALRAALAVRVLPDGMDRTAATCVYNELAAADLAADEAWASVSSRADYDARRVQMREKMIAAVGGFPARTPLEARTTGVVERKGYRVEKVVFSSLPGVYVTGNLFLPTDPKSAGPRPVVVVTCGHSGEGKACPGYQRGCVQAVEAGFAAFVFDPFDQGERLQDAKTRLNLCNGHNAVGVRAALLGLSTARFRIWDGMRAIDYLCTRKEIDSSRIGYMGNSGGGTMTSLMMSVEPRIKAAAPSCYVTNLRALCAHIGPQDAEQNVFGQLSFGLNHAGYVLLQNVPVSVTGTYDDFFSYYGMRETWRTAELCLAKVGDGAKLARADVPGQHGWRESTRTASVLWMRRWLLDDRSAAPFDMAALRRLDLSFDPDCVDMGLSEKESRVTPSGQVLDLPGARSLYDVLRDLHADAVKRRPARSAAELAACVRRRAGIRLPHEVNAVAAACAPAQTNVAGWTAQKFAFAHPDGFSVPAVLVTPAVVKAAPVLVVCDGARTNALADARAALAAGAPVLAADLGGWGETAKPLHSFYGAPNADEGMALMLYLLGDSLVGRRASDILALADWLNARFKRTVRLVAHGRAAIPAAHAYAADRVFFAAIDLPDAPGSWADALARTGRYAFADVVPGALLDYDWPDLLK